MHNVVAGPGTLQFVLTQVTVSEGIGVYKAQIERVNGADGAVSCNIGTSSQTATYKVDYLSDGVYSYWADQETGIKNTSGITIYDDSNTESKEYFDALISGVTGGASKGPNQRVYIDDNEDDCVDNINVTTTSRNSTIFNIGDTVAYSCKSGYVRQSGDQTVSCGSGKSLSGTPLKCTAGTAPAPTTAAPAPTTAAPAPTTAAPAQGGGATTAASGQNAQGGGATTAANGLAGLNLGGGAAYKEPALTTILLLLCLNIFWFRLIQKD